LPRYLLYQSLGRFSEAETFHQRALAILMATVGENHPNTQKVLDGLKTLKELTGGQDISKRCPQKFLGSSVTNRYIPFSQKANERIRDLGELIRNLYQQWGVICIELFRSNTPKSLCCKEFSQLVPLSVKEQRAANNESPN
jgi:hypothetical protein